MTASEKGWSVSDRKLLWNLAEAIIVAILVKDDEGWPDDGQIVEARRIAKEILNG